MNAADLSRVRLALAIRAAVATGQRPHVEYRERPLDWIVEKLGIPRRTLVWGENPGYEDCRCGECERYRAEAARKGDPVIYGPHRWDGTPGGIVGLLDAIGRADRLIGVEAGTGTQKSHTLACVILWFLACWEGARAFTYAPKEDQLRLYIWTEIYKLWPRFKEMFPQATLGDLRLRMRGHGDDSWGAAGIAVQIRAEQDVPAAARGIHAEHMLIVGEETQGMDKRIVAAHRDTSTAPHNIRVYLGNPENPADTLHAICTTPGATAIRLSGLDHPNVVCGDAGIVPGAVSRVTVEERRRTLGERSRDFKRGVRGLCPEGGGSALPELLESVHMIDELPTGGTSPPEHWPVFGSLDEGFAHPFAFGAYTVDEHGTIYKLDTLSRAGRHIDQIAQDIKDRFDVRRFDYMVAGGDTFQKRQAGTHSSARPVVSSELFAAEGLFFTRAADGPHSRRPNLVNFRDYLKYMGRGPVDPTTGEAKDGRPSFYLLRTPGNEACFRQLQSMVTDPKSPEEPLKVNADAQTGLGGDDMYDETAKALASRPYSARVLPKFPTPQEELHERRRTLLEGSAPKATTGGGALFGR